METYNGLQKLCMLTFDGVPRESPHSWSCLLEWFRPQTRNFGEKTNCSQGLYRWLYSHYSTRSERPLFMRFPRAFKRQEYLNFFPGYSFTTLESYEVEMEVHRLKMAEVDFKTLHTIAFLHSIKELLEINSKASKVIYEIFESQISNKELSDRRLNLSDGNSIKLNEIEWDSDHGFMEQNLANSFCKLIAAKCKEAEIQVINGTFSI